MPRFGCVQLQAHEMNIYIIFFVVCTHVCNFVIVKLFKVSSVVHCIIYHLNSVLPQSVVTQCHMPWQSLPKPSFRTPGTVDGAVHRNDRWPRKCWMDIVIEWVSAFMLELLMAAFHIKYIEEHFFWIVLRHVPPVTCSANQSRDWF